MDKLTHCPNCNVKLKGMIGSIKMMSQNDINFAKDYGKFQGQHLCQKCSPEVILQAKNKLHQEKKDLSVFIKQYYSLFPIVTIQNPPNWEFDTIGVVTAQATKDNSVKTGFFEDLFDMNQNVVDLNKSANKGERMCFEAMRQKAFNMKGNAILGVDIDYSEFGSKGELMLICMAGTVVNLKNLSDISEKFADFYLQYLGLSPRIQMMQKYSNY